MSGLKQDGAPPVGWGCPASAGRKRPREGGLSARRVPPGDHIRECRALVGRRSREDEQRLALHRLEPHPVRGEGAYPLGAVVPALHRARVQGEAFGAPYPTRQSPTRGSCRKSFSRPLRSRRAVRAGVPGGGRAPGDACAGARAGQRAGARACVTRGAARGRTPTGRMCATREGCSLSEGAPGPTISKG